MPCSKVAGFGGISLCGFAFLVFLWFVLFFPGGEKGEVLLFCFL